MRRATSGRGKDAARYPHFYPRSPCGERQQPPIQAFTVKRISIHALLAESDASPKVRTQQDIISIHALLAESDQPPIQAFTVKRISIHALLAESDVAARIPGADSSDFYPRSPCGERQTCEVIDLLPDIISIHALLAESDNTAAFTETCRWKFLSTLSLRRATSAAPPAASWQPYFYPRSPCGERRTP